MIEPWKKDNCRFVVFFSLQQKLTQKLKVNNQRFSKLYTENMLF